MDDDTTSVTAALFGLAGFEVVAAADAGGELELLVATTADLVGCPSCGAVARAKDRRPSWVRDLPIGGRPVVLCWWKRVWSCPQPLCEQKTWTEQHPAIAPRASLTERARQWAFEQVGVQDAAVATVADDCCEDGQTAPRRVRDQQDPAMTTRLVPAVQRTHVGGVSAARPDGWPTLSQRSPSARAVWPAVVRALLGSL